MVDQRDPRDPNYPQQVGGPPVQHRQTHWDQAGAAPATYQDSGSHVGVTIAGIILILFGLLTTLGGILLLVAGQFAGGLLPFATAEGGAEAGSVVGAVAGVITVIAIVVLVIGLLHLASGIGVLVRKEWARILGILMSVLGLLLGVLSLFGALQPANNVGAGDPASGLPVAIVITVAYGFALFALARGGNYFRRSYS